MKHTGLTDHEEIATLEIPGTRSVNQRKPREERNRQSKKMMQYINTI